jgi:hypothetical protein
MSTLKIPDPARAHAPPADVPVAHRVIIGFNELTDAQFDFWLEALNGAVRAQAPPGARTFARDDREKTISYWYLIGALVAQAALAVDVLGDLEAQPEWLATGVEAGKLADLLGGKYKPETVRRYMTDLKQLGLVRQHGRGEGAFVSVARATAEAYVRTLRHWRVRFRALEEEMRALEGA